MKFRKIEITLGKIEIAAVAFRRVILNIFLYSARQSIDRRFEYTCEKPHVPGVAEPGGGGGGGGGGARGAMAPPPKKFEWVGQGMFCPPPPPQILTTGPP